MHVFVKKIKQAFFIGLYVLAILIANTTQAQVNYVRTFDATAPEQNANALMGRWVSDVKTTTQYIDGLGRPIQTVVKQGSLQSSNNEFADVVASIVYDEFGREPLKYLPFAANNAGGNTAITNGSYKTNALAQQQAFATAQYLGETHFYSKTNFEPSPLNRPTDSYAPGTSWAGSETAAPALQRNVQMKYFINTLLDEVRIWNVNNDPVIGNFGTYTTTTFYPAGELYKNITIDEHKKQVIEFKDKEGKVILKKVQIGNITDNGAGVNNTDFLCTYYIYDDLNNIRCVIQPEGVKQLPTANYQLSTILLAEQCFRYEYDNRNRMVKKKVAGAGEVCMVYDERDRLILTQDANMRVGTVKWLYTKYDELNRPIANGLWPSTLTYTQHAANTIGNLAYPVLTGEEELSRTFYDNYTWLTNPLYTNPLSATYNNTFDTHFQPASNSNWPYAQANAATAQLKGMVTGSRTKVLGTVNTYLYSIPFYDEKGRAIQSQSTNITGGIDISTTQYTWAGQPLVSISKQQLAGGQSTVTVTQLSYDDLRRVTKTEKKISNTLVNGGTMAAYKTIAENKYDKLGQLVNKNLGTKANTTTALAKLAYEYNIRGWLTSVNKNFVAAGNNGANNDEYFGMQLGYDKDAFGAFTKKAYNGNIAGTIWRSAGDGIDRKYDYDYDNANRLLKADFTQHDGTAFTINPLINFNVKMGDGTNSITNNAYDDNGNIKQMQQWGLKINNSAQIDNLAYTYITGTNKLAKVNDVGVVTTDNGKLGDFKDGTNTNDDYLYDANGNLNLDNNKAISSITYNHLNLPSVINITGKGSIIYTYDAAGNKLRKVTSENPIAANGNKTITTTTNYINGLLYETKSTSPVNTPNTDYTDVLQYIPHEEGRIRFKPAIGTSPAHFAFDFILKDHLNNSRIILTEEQQQDVYPAATLEPALVATESSFYTIDQTKIVPNSAANYLRDANNNEQTYQNNNLPIANNNPSCGTGNLCKSALSANVYQLNSNANKTGLGITLKVMAGDKIDVLGKSYYYQNNPTPNSPPTSTILVLDILNAFLGGASGASATSAHGAVTGTAINTTDGTNIITGGLFANQNNQSSTYTSRPKAFINYIFFDEQFKAISSGASMVGNNKELKNHLQDLQNLSATKSGFVYIYCSNESPVNVFFDNVQVVHTRGALLETNEFYLSGLKIDGISYKSAGGFENKKLFLGKELQNKEFSDGSGLELYDMGARNYDQQTMHFTGIDMLANKFSSWSPYSYSFDNPVRFSDGSGMAPDDIVYFNNKGQEIDRIKSNTVFKTYIVADNAPFYPGSDGRAHPAGFSVTEAAMPNIVQTRTQSGENVSGGKYQVNDYQIAASTFLANKSLKSGGMIVADKGGNIISQSELKSVGEISPTLVKAWSMQESHSGTNGSILQVNNNGDFTPDKTAIGIKKGDTYTAGQEIDLSIRYAIGKGFSVDKATYSNNGKTVTRDYTWNGWTTALKNYNGLGVIGYENYINTMVNESTKPQANNY